jgi:hypothetical protein
MKKTWKLELFLDQFKLTEAEAIKILQENIFRPSYNWKHGAAKTEGIMWRDKYIQELFKLVLIDEDILVKKVGRKKVQKELFWRSSVLKHFVIISGLSYKRTDSGYLSFKNDYAKWKQLKFFKPSWKKGKITHKKVLQRIKASNKKIDALETAESKKRKAGQEHTRGLYESGEWEKTAAGLRKIIK